MNGGWGASQLRREHRFGAVVTPQRIENGVATIQIIEGYIGDVSVEGGSEANAERRVGVLVDHLVPGSKERRLADDALRRDLVA